jgi:hypothetical protein
MSQPATNDWPSLSEHWRALALANYTPISNDRCDEIVQETLHAIKTHKLPHGIKETDTTSPGWRDWYHLDDDGLNVRFLSAKRLANADTKQVADHTWTLYGNGDLYKAAHLGKDAELFHQTLQQISPDVMIIQRVEKYPDLKQLTHSLAIALHVQTETGYMIVFRCIASPQLQSVMKADGLSMGGSFYWEKFDVAKGDGEGECNAIQFTAAGSVGSDNPTYAKRWRDEIRKALVRYESELKDTALISNEAAAVEVSGVVPTVSQDAFCTIL